MAVDIFQGLGTRGGNDGVPLAVLIDLLQDVGGMSLRSPPPVSHRSFSFSDLGIGSESLTLHLNSCL